MGIPVAATRFLGTASIDLGIFRSALKHSSMGWFGACPLQAGSGTGRPHSHPRYSCFSSNGSRLTRGTSRRSRCSPEAGSGRPVTAGRSPDRSGSPRNSGDGAPEFLSEARSDAAACVLGMVCLVEVGLEPRKRACPPLQCQPLGQPSEVRGPPRLRRGNYTT